MENMRSVINKHNSRVLSKTKSNAKPPATCQTNVHSVKPPATSCNCRNKENCPLPGNCLATNVIYKAEVTTTDDMMKKKYIGMTANQFKLRYNNHNKSFRDPIYSKDTVLSSYIWKLKNEGRKFLVKWSILKRARAYESGAKRCNLCLEEKLCIMKAEKKDLLNKRTEIFSKCRHKNKFRICNMKRNNARQ